MKADTLNNCVDIMLLVHYHYFPVEHPDVVRETPAAKESITWLLKRELLVSAPGPFKGKDAASWETSEKGRVMVNKLLSVPLPVATWS